MLHYMRGGRQLGSLQWHQATSIEVCFRGHKGDQAQQGSVIVRTRDDPSGARSGAGAGGCAVALMVELLSSYYPTLPDSVPLSPYRCANEFRVWGYNEALRSLREVIEKAGYDPSEVAFHSLRIGAATTLAAGGEVSQRVTQREGRWKSPESSNVYTRNLSLIHI